MAKRKSTTSEPIRHITTRQIADEAGCNPRTILNWADKLQVGHKPHNRSRMFSDDEAALIKDRVRSGPGQPPKEKS